MIALDLVSDELPTLDAKESCLLALQWMDEYKVKHLPVVDGSEYLGLISDSMILDLEDPDQNLGNLRSQLMKIAVLSNQHAFKVIKVFSDFDLSAVAVLNEKEQYLGSICLYQLMRQLSSLVAMKDAGSLVVLEVNQHDYSLSEIAQIVEGNDASIMGLYITSVPDSTLLEITLKINRGNVDGILQTFARYDYIIKATFQDKQFNDYLQDRYDELMRYLNM